MATCAALLSFLVSATAAVEGSVQSWQQGSDPHDSNGGASWVKRTDRFCGEVMGTIVGSNCSFASAHRACEASPDCMGVYDRGCDALGPFYLCRRDERRPPLVSQREGCLRIKPDASVRNGADWPVRKSVYCTPVLPSVYLTLREAKVACARDRACGAVCDVGCTPVLGYQLCNRSVEFLASSEGSCVRTKPKAVAGGSYNPMIHAHLPPIHTS